MIWRAKAKMAEPEGVMNRKLMVRVFRCALLAANLILSPAIFTGGIVAPAGAQTSAATAAVKPADYSKPEEHARTVGKELLARGIPGLSVAVAVDGKIVYSEGFGYADLEERVPVWPTTKFRIGSVSKPLTSAALVLLVEQGKLDLDAPVQKYVPTFPGKGSPITSRMLAGHLGGIRHYKDDEFLISKHYDNVVEGLKIFQDDPLVAPPGTQFNYSSYGYNLLSAVVQGASGQDFLAYMQQRVFTPLGLRDTLADQPADIIAQRARFYTRHKDKPMRNAPFVDNSYKWAGGGFLSSAEDLVRFGSALLQPGFLKPESLRLLFTSQKTSDGKETGYGMGWAIHNSKSGQRVYEHSGGSAGGSSQLILYPDAHVVVAMICNFEGDDGWRREDIESIGEAFENR
jgi:serine beta-lactamase-like protein LACTB, mitochondrial